MSKTVISLKGSVHCIISREIKFHSIQSLPRESQADPVALPNFMIEIFLGITSEPSGKIGIFPGSQIYTKKNKSYDL